MGQQPKQGLAVVAVKPTDGGEQLRQRQPLERVRMQQPFPTREAAQPLRVGGVLERLLVVRALGDVEREDGDVGAVEGPLQREQLEEQHAESPHVGRLVVRSRVNQLRREVEGRAADSYGEAGVRRERLGDAEVA
eukprot:scaffold11778_cov49-Phaeocystis_antarctica.AAC.3